VELRGIGRSAPHVHGNDARLLEILASRRLDFLPPAEHPAYYGMLVAEVSR